MYSSSVIITHFECKPIKKSQSSISAANVSNSRLPKGLTTTTTSENYPTSISSSDMNNMSGSSLSIYRFNYRIVIEDFVHIGKNSESGGQNRILHRESSIASFTTPFVHSKNIQPFLNRADSLSASLNELSSNLELSSFDFSLLFTPIH